jgi:hypothetical protein
MLYERVSGMKMNFHKSECIAMNVDESRAHEVAHILNCPMGSLPVRYLGVTLHFEKLRREDIQSILDKLIRRMAD